MPGRKLSQQQTIRASLAILPLQARAGRAGQLSTAQYPFNTLEQHQSVRDSKCAASPRDTLSTTRAIWLVAEFQVSACLGWLKGCPDPLAGAPTRLGSC